MANRMFTKRNGQQVECKDLIIPADAVSSIMRLQEEYASRGHIKSLLFVALDMLSTGKDSIERRWENAAKNKANRNAGKAVKEYIRVQLQLRRPIDPLVIAELSGMQVPDGHPTIEMEDTLDGDGTLDHIDLTDEQLEAATDPNGHVA